MPGQRPRQMSGVRATVLSRSGEDHLVILVRRADSISQARFPPDGTMCFPVVRMRYRAGVGESMLRVGPPNQCSRIPPSLAAIADRNISFINVLKLDPNPAAGGLTTAQPFPLKSQTASTQPSAADRS
jgi:hypothetical protein